MVGAFYIPEGPFTRGTVNVPHGILTCISSSLFTDLLGNSGSSLVENAVSAHLCWSTLVHPIFW